MRGPVMYTGYAEGFLYMHAVVLLTAECSQGGHVGTAVIVSRTISDEIREGVDNDNPRTGSHDRKSGAPASLNPIPSSQRLPPTSDPAEKVRATYKTSTAAALLRVENIGRSFCVGYLGNKLIVLSTRVPGYCVQQQQCNMGDPATEDNATLSVSVLDGIVDPLKL